MLAFCGAGSDAERMGMIVADQAAGVGGAAVGDGSRAIRRHDVLIKIHQAFAGNIAGLRAHSVGRVAHRARESILLNMAGVFAEASVIHDLRQDRGTSRTTHRGRRLAPPSALRFGLGKELVTSLPGTWRLAEFIAALENVGKDRPVRSVRSVAAEFAVVVAIVAVGAQDSRAHGAPHRPAIEVQQFARRLGCGYTLLRSWNTGWLEVANC